MNETTQILEKEIILQLLNNKKYFSTVIHFLEPKYFETQESKEVFKKIKELYGSYHKIPTLKELALGFSESPKPVRQIVIPFIKELNKETPTVDEKMLLDKTEKFVKLAIFKDAIIEGADAIGSNNIELIHSSYTKAEEAVTINLTSNLGVALHEIDKIYDEFQDKPGVLTNIKSWDDMFGAGVTPKTLSAIAAASGIGKSATMVDFAVRYLLQGKDVVIISLEMSEAEFYKRIYANLFDIDIELIKNLDKQVLINKLNDVKDKLGNLVIKEFPTGGLTPLGVEGYLEQLKTERGMNHPIVFVDYLGIMSSDKIKNSDNSYAYFGSIAEELRAVAQKREIVMWTALQLNRSAINNLEADQSSLSESMKIMMTLDFLAILSQTKEMKNKETGKGDIRVFIAKNRFSGKTYTFDIEFDYKKFKFIDKFNIAGENVTNHELNSVKNLGELINF